VSEFPTGTVTFLITDIEGSTRLLTTLGAEGYADVLAEHRRVIRAAVARHRGVEVGTEGDSFFIAFSRASDALAAAAEAQAALASGPVRVRMGVHSGEPLLTDEGYVGRDVHRAARIAAAGHGGQVLLSATTRAFLEDGFELRDLGGHRLKDLGAPERLFQLGGADFPPLRSLNTTNLPAPDSPLVGRLSEVAELRDLVSAYGVRLVTLTGPGGTGKTRLALAVASELVPEFVDGAFFVELAHITDPALVAAEVARTIGVRDPGEERIDDGLVAHLTSQSLLLILDNFEQAMGAAPLVARLVRACPDVAVIVTSRAALRVSDEREFPVAPLSLPAPRATATEISRSDAVVLFLQRAQAVAPSFALTERTATAVAEICRRLDGIPLAIELAAARTKLLSAGDLLVRLEHRLPVLTGGRRDAPERQRTLRSAIEWSYELLDAPAKHLFSRLAIFPGTFSLGAAERVVGADLDATAGLVDVSLVQPLSEGRFRMLETIREFAGERLVESDEEVYALRWRHAEYFLALADEAERGLGGADQATWLDAIEADHDNLRSAVAWFAVVDQERQLRLAVALRRFWYVRGFFTEARRTLIEALAGAGGAPELRRKAVAAVAANALIQGDYTEAERFAEEGVGLARAVGDPASAANALSNLGAIVLASGDSERARRLLQEAVELARRSGDPRVLALAVNNLGDVALTVGDYVFAEESFAESLSSLREQGDMANVARSLCNLAAAELQQGRRDDALLHLRESIVLSRDLGDAEDLAWCLEAFAAAAAAGGDPRRAGVLLGAAGSVMGNVGATHKAFERRQHEETVGAARSALGESDLATTTAEGQEMTADEAVEAALAIR
jgi:predicted ATPase/class 3 adenylate cyclase